MNEPTEAQIKGFWEWCGWLYDQFGWHSPEVLASRELHVANERPPKLDLNNLRKYAVPKLQSEHEVVLRWSSIEVRDGDRNYLVCPEGWQSTVFGQKGSLIDTQATHLSDPALALFWAIHDTYKQERNG